MVSECVPECHYDILTLSLNPCFSGGWSRSIPFETPQGRLSHGLNPCFSGGWSRRLAKCFSCCTHRLVLILVLVEDGLGGHGVS